MTDRLLVLLSGVEVGVLERESSGDPTFAYLPEYVADGHVALSTRLPIQARPFASTRVRPYLAGLLPENEETRRAWGSQLGVHPSDAFGILARMGWDCPGAVQFCRESEIEELHARSDQWERASDQEIGGRVRELAAGEPSWTMQDEHWSLGGQQQKFALTRRNGEWHTAHGSAATTHIVKPGITALHHQALLEHLTMAAAESLGIDVASTCFSEFDGEWAIVIERFDRVAEADRIARIHQEDFAQACGRMPHQKYESSDGPGISDMIRVIKRASTDLQEDRFALMDFLAFNLLAGAPDGHAKNIALLHTPSAVHVAPLFDLATGLAYDADQVDRSVAVSVGGERLASRIHRRQWERAAQQLEVDSDVVVERVEKLATNTVQAFEAALAALPANTPGNAQVAERLLPALRKHSTAVLERL